MQARHIGPVIVGVDGSANARRALIEAARVARAEGAPLVAVHAVGLTEIIDHERVPTEGHHDEIVANVDEWCRALDDAGYHDYQSELVDGPPVDALLRAAHDAGASLIVVGRRGAGDRPELLLGSTAHQIVEHSRCPVLVIPPLGRSAAVSDEPA